MARTPVSTSLVGGVERLILVPSPSWPWSLFPQQRIPLASMSAHV